MPMAPVEPVIALDLEDQLGKITVDLNVDDLRFEVAGIGSGVIGDGFEKGGFVERPAITIYVEVVPVEDRLELACSAFLDRTHSSLGEVDQDIFFTHCAERESLRVLNSLTERLGP